MPGLMALFAGFVALATTMLGVAVWREAGAAARDQAAPPPGRLVDIGGRRLHIVCRGEGPTVVLEAGGATPAMLFRRLQDRISPFARVCVYDRAGFGWSDPAGDGRSFDEQAEDLFKLLAAAEAPGPYILAGESLGAMIIRACARQRPGAVSAILMIDGAEEGVVYADYRAFRRSGTGALWIGPTLSRLGLLRRAAMNRPTALGLPASLTREDRSMLVRYMTRPGFWRRARDEIAAYDLAPAHQRAAGGMGDLGDLPLTVIAHGRPMSGGLGELESGWRAGQERLASLSTQGRLVIAEHSAHDISLTDPDLVARELLLLVSRVSGTAFADHEGPP